MLKRILNSKKGEGYIDIAVGVLCLMLVVAMAAQFMPVFVKKQQLDLFAAEIMREAEITGGTNVSSRIDMLRGQTGLNPDITWECEYYSGNSVQLNGDITVTLTDRVDVGFFTFGSFPIEIRAKASGKSEVYYK
ncbi:MAG: DUF4320 family protein [Lachnospiraceae bacterium]|nr:DUF4320 family protein [Lachnospiraceae bacterium]